MEGKGIRAGLGISMAAVLVACLSKVAANTLQMTMDVLDRRDPDVSVWPYRGGIKTKSVVF